MPDNIDPEGPVQPPFGQWQGGPSSSADVGPSMPTKEIPELIGRTIVKAEREVAIYDWGYQGGDVYLTLDDGTVVSIESHGYDAWESTLSINGVEQD